jgi:hypothetical protein
MRKREKGAHRRQTNKSEKIENRRRKSVLNVHCRVNGQQSARGKWPATEKNYDGRGHVQTSLVLGLDLAVFAWLDRAAWVRILTLRHQLAVYKRKSKKPLLRNRDRLFWSLLSKIWRDWRSELILVEPETVIRWRERKFREFWRRKSQNKEGGRSGKFTFIPLLLDSQRSRTEVRFPGVPPTPGSAHHPRADFCRLSTCLDQTFPKLRAGRALPGKWCTCRMFLEK